MTGSAYSASVGTELLGIASFCSASNVESRGRESARAVGGANGNIIRGRTIRRRAGGRGGGLDEEVGGAASGIGQQIGIFEVTLEASGAKTIAGEEIAYSVVAIDHPKPVAAD